MKIAVATTTRSEYSLNKWIIKEIIDDKELELQLLVGGTHLSPFWGETYKEIEKDGIKDFYKIEFTLASDTPQALSKSIGLASISVAQIFDKDKPDFLLINGDRYELFGFILPAILFKIPIGHIGGGEITEGAIDDCIRHSISKLSNLHFVSCKEYARNLSLLGEEDWRIHIVGAEGVENIVRMKLYNIQQISKKIGLNLENPTVLVTYHPATAEKNIIIEEQIDSLLGALEQFKDLQIIFTYPGAEVGAEIIINKLKTFVNKCSDRTRFFESLGGKLYLSIMKYVKCVIGNSSSGIIEAPFLKVPTINIGNRQKGRVRAKSVIDVNYEPKDIAHYLGKILEDEKFVKDITSGKYPFGDGNVSKRVINAIKDELYNSNLLVKKLISNIEEEKWHQYW